MENHFENLMKFKSDEELNEYLTNVTRYKIEAIEAAIEESKKRGKVFTDEELNLFFLQVENQYKKDYNVNAENSWNKNIVIDENAPQYYSKKTIFYFSVFFGVLYGAILLSLNINSKKTILKVILFAFAYTIVQIMFSSIFNNNIGINLGLSLGGSIILKNYFWKKYIGDETKYQVKPFLKPLIIGFVIYIPILIFISPL